MSEFEKLLIARMGETISATARIVLKDLVEEGVLPADGPQNSAQAAIGLLGVMALPLPGQTIACVDYWRNAMLFDTSTLKTTANVRTKESCWNNAQVFAELRQQSPALFLPLLDLLTGIIERHRNSDHIGAIGENKVLALSLNHATHCACLEINLHANYDGGTLTSLHEYMVHPDYAELQEAGQWPPAKPGRTGAYTCVSAPGQIFPDIAAFLNGRLPATPTKLDGQSAGAEARVH